MGEGRGGVGLGKWVGEERGREGRGGVREVGGGGEWSGRGWVKLIVGVSSTRMC